MEKEAKTRYLIEVPSSRPGIYLIVNIIKKLAYVGLSNNLPVRTLDHFKAICCNKNDSADEARSIWIIKSCWRKRTRAFSTSRYGSGLRRSRSAAAGCTT